MFTLQPALTRRAGVWSLNNPTCGICGRPLSDPESIKIGIGPKCWKDLTRDQRLEYLIKRDTVEEPRDPIQEPREYIETVAGRAYYWATLNEPEFNFLAGGLTTKAGYWVIHKGSTHYVYAIKEKAEVVANE